MIRRLGLLTLLALASLPLLHGSARGDDAASREAASPDPAELALTTSRVVIFKDGYALFVRTGTATVDAEGHVHTYDVPDAAVLGSFWAFAKDQRTVGMQAQFVTTTASREDTVACLSMLELLRANRGRSVSLTLSPEGSARGLIVEVLEQPATEPAAEPPAPRGRPSARARRADGTDVERTSLGGAYVNLQQVDGTHLILPISQVATLSGQDLVTQRTRVLDSTTTRKRLQIDLGAERAGTPAEVTLLHFGPGLRWIPTYRVGGALETSADVALQAEILNEVMDLDGVPADLVVGVPHFRFGEVISPLSLEGTLQNVLQQAAPQLMGQQIGSNAMFSNRAGERRDTRGPGLDLAPELAAEGAQDLFVYSLPRLTLPKGARAAVPLWQSTVPLQHIYTLDVELGRDLRGGRPQVRSSTRNGRRDQEDVSPLELAAFDVWHQLQLTNDTDVPWTTGAALTSQGMLPLGQDMITYTSRGAAALLPLTVAVEVQAGYDEIEVEREPNKTMWRGNAYALVTKRATARITNRRPEPTTLRVRLALGGKAVSASDLGVLRINDYRASDWTDRGYDMRLNNHTDIEWNVVLAPGEVKELSTIYQFYVH
jgi:hypothetical protein